MAASDAISGAAQGAAAGSSFGPWGAAIGGGLGLLGGILGSKSADKAAQAQLQAGREANAANLEAARIAADAAKFKPYSITSGFGQGFFDTEKGTAGYNIDPRLAAFRDTLYGQAEQTMGALGTPEQQAQQYYQQQMGLLAPQRLQEDIAAREASLRTGRVGLGVSAGYGGAGDVSGMLNPDEFARMRARELSNAQIANESTTYGQNLIDKLIARGTGLFTSGAGVEQLGMMPLTMGADIGNKSSVSQGQQANALLQGGMAGSRAMLEGSTGATQYNLASGLAMGGALQGAGKAISGMDFSKMTNPFSGMFTQAPAASPSSNYWSGNTQPAMRGNYSFGG
jgi:hypothetical protein